MKVINVETIKQVLLDSVIVTLLCICMVYLLRLLIPEYVDDFNIYNISRTFILAIPINYFLYNINKNINKIKN